MKKPDAVTVIPPDGFREKIWYLPASALLYVGPKTGRKLHDLGICTIGDLAQAPTEVLQARLSKNGLLLQLFANGLDTVPVMPTTAEAAIKSIGNSTTTPPGHRHHRGCALCVLPAGGERGRAVPGERLPQPVRVHFRPHDGFALLFLPDHPVHAHLHHQRDRCTGLFAL